MYRMVLMSGVWYSKRIKSFYCDTDLADSLESVQAGDVIAFTDDVDYFADELGIAIDDIVDVN